MSEASREGRRRGQAFVVAAPSGTGKTTICAAIVERDPLIEVSVSHTTRKPREGEEQGIHYHFVESGTFLDMVNKNEFLEHAMYNNNNYGTSREALREQMEERGLDVLLEIEVQGARQIREKATGAKFIFLLPPSIQELARRLRQRDTDDSDTINKRLAIVDNELAEIGLFDYAVINDDLEQAVDAVAEIIHTEREGDETALAELRARHGREVVHAAWRKANPDALRTD